MSRWGSPRDGRPRGIVPTTSPPPIRRMFSGSNDRPPILRRQRRPSATELSGATSLSKNIAVPSLFSTRTKKMERIAARYSEMPSPTSTMWASRSPASWCSARARLGMPASSTRVEPLRNSSMCFAGWQRSQKSTELIAMEELDWLPFGAKVSDFLLLVEGRVERLDQAGEARRDDAPH